jgi:hypothetical protein
VSDGTGGPKLFALESRPGALGAIARLRSAGGLAAAALVAYLSHGAGVPISSCMLRGLVAGVVGYFVAWYVGVTFWRAVLRAEVRAALERRAAARPDADA